MRSIFARELPVTPSDYNFLPATATQVKNARMGSEFGADLAISGTEPGLNVLSWDFDAIAGMYELWAEYAAAKSRPTQIDLNGATVVSDGLADTTGGWNSQQCSWVFQANVSLIAGGNQLTISRQHSIPHIRALRLTPARTPALVDISHRRASPQFPTLTPLSGELLADFVQFISPKVRSILGKGAEPASVCSTVSHVVDAILFDFANPQKRLGFGGPLNGQLIRQALFSSLDRLFHFDVFVETGAYTGTTTDMLASYGRPVFSCEKTEEFYYRSAARLAGMANVNLLMMDSREFLKHYVASYSRQFSMPLFYLDAHWYGDLPLPEEISIIHSGLSKYVIMVDDFKHPLFKYPYDRYANGVELSLEYVLPRLKSTTGVDFLFPIHHEGMESGARRGTLIIAPQKVSEDILHAGIPLMRWNEEDIAR